MARYTIDIRGETENRLNEYMRNNKINLKSVGIKQCIFDATNKEDLNLSLIELDKKLNRIIYRQTMIKKLLDQLFANMGFPINEKTEKDEMLKEFYNNNNKYTGRYD